MQLNFVANARVPSSSGRSLVVLDPSDGQPFDDIQRSNAHDVADAVAAARDAFDGVWSKFAAAERGRLLLRLAQEVEVHAGELAAIVQRDGGKPPRHAVAQVAALAHCLALVAATCERLQGEPVSHQNGYRVLSWREPYGVTAHLIPWYDPLRIFGRGVGAALAAGNVCIVKPAEETSLALLRVAELAAKAGFPAGAINILTGYDQEVGEALARHKGVDHVSLAGSPKLATLVQQAAAEHNCPVALTLGGKSPRIVFADASLDAAVPAIVHAVLHGACHTRAAGARLLVERAAYPAVLDRLEAAFEALRVGPAHVELGLDMGPLIRQSQQQRVWDFLSDAHVAGIAMVAQGVVVDEAPETGFYQAPTLLCDVPLPQALALEDVPGPVLAATPFDTEEQALALANASSFNAVAHLWTSDEARQLRLAKGLRCARVAVNDSCVENDAQEAFNEVLAFTSLKTVAIRQ